MVGRRTVRTAGVGGRLRRGPDGRFGGACLGLAHVEAQHPIADLEREQQIHPQIRHPAHGELDDAIGYGLVNGALPQRSVVGCPLRSTDEEQRGAAAETWGECPFTGPNAAAAGVRIVALGSASRESWLWSACAGARASADSRMRRQEERVIGRVPATAPDRRGIGGAAPASSPHTSVGGGTS